MLSIALDAVVLMLLLKVANDDDLGFGTAFLVALVAAIGTTVLAFALGAILGIGGIVIAAVLAAAVLGVAVAALFGVEVKRAFMIGVVFMLVHIGISFGIRWMMAT